MGLVVARKIADYGDGWEILGQLLKEDVAAPVRSLFQTDSIALHSILDAASRDAAHHVGR